GADRAIHLEAAGCIGYLAALEDVFDPGQRTVVDLDSGLGAGHLNRRRFPEEIRQGVQQAQDQGHQYGEILPEWVAVHGKSEAGAGKGAPEGAWRLTDQSDLIVPLGRTDETAVRCTRISTGLSA